MAHITGVPVGPCTEIVFLCVFFTLGQRQKAFLTTVSLYHTVLVIPGVQLGVLLLAVQTMQLCSMVGNWCRHSSLIALSHVLM